MYIVCDLVVKSVGIFYSLVTLGAAMDFSIENESFIFSKEKEKVPKSFDDPLREAIRSHVMNYPAVFSALEKGDIRKFLGEVEKLTNQGILFRADNLEFQEDIFNLLEDYKKLLCIALPSSMIMDVNKYLMEIQENYHDTFLANANAKIQVDTNCKITRQIFSLKTIKWESVEYYKRQSSNILKIDDMKKKSSVSIQTQIDIQSLLCNFWIGYTDLIKEIELERMSFILMLKKNCLITTQDIHFETMINSFPEVIEKYKVLLCDIEKEEKVEEVRGNIATEKSSSLPLEINMGSLPKPNSNKFRFHVTLSDSGSSSPSSRSAANGSPSSWSESNPSSSRSMGSDSPSSRLTASDSPKSKKPWWK